jgi:hypothetical protein
MSGCILSITPNYGPAGEVNSAVIRGSGTPSFVDCGWTSKVGSQWVTVRYDNMTPTQVTAVISFAPDPTIDSVLTFTCAPLSDWQHIAGSIDFHFLGPPPPTPVPLNRGRWRLTLHERMFTIGPTYASTLIAEIVHARSVRLEQARNKPAQLSFVLDGSSPSAPLIHELQTDVVAWRWDEKSARDVPMFRGIVTQSQDTLSEQADSVQFTCHDYLAMLSRRLLRSQISFTQMDQDTLATTLVNFARAVPGWDAAASSLPLLPVNVGPDGAARDPSGVLRDRSYEASQEIGEAIDNLANVENANTDSSHNFYYDVLPQASGLDSFRIFYPYQGMLRPDLLLEYGSSVRALSRSVNSGNYANFVQAVGSVPPDSPQGTPPLVSEAANEDANGQVVGLWMTGENAPDVSVQTTLDEKAAGDLAQAGVLLPTYSIELRWGWYTWGNPRMGDVVKLVIQAGRLDVVADVEVVAITYDYSDDGEENVLLDVGRPDTTFGDLLTAQRRDVNALARR